MTKKIETQEPETVESLTAKLAEAQAIIDAQKKTREGWYIETPNMAYSGPMFHGEIVFSQGACFLRRDAVIDYFVPQLRPDQIQKLSKDEQDALVEDYKAASSEKAVKNLESDFGYHARYFTKDESSALDAAIASHKERSKPALAEAERQEKELINRMTENRPSYP